ncbi:hypothetical protein GBL57_11545, partial [Streptococcus equi]|nr:hypothetical protein [Streptococcus equi]
MAKAKLRILLYGIWYFIVFLILRERGGGEGEGRKKGGGGRKEGRGGKGGGKVINKIEKKQKR